MAAEIEKLKDLFEESCEQMKKVKEEAKVHYDYYSGDQLPEDVKEILRERHQPEYWKNLYQMNLNKIVGYMVNSNTQVRVIGRQKQDEKLAGLMNDLLIYIQQKERYKRQRKAFLLDLALAGYTVAEAYPVPVGEDDWDVKIVHVPYDEVFLDMFSKAEDYSDARYIHRAFWAEKELLYQYFPKEKVDKLTPYENYTEDRLLDLNVDEYNNVSLKRDLVLIVATWWKDKDDIVRYAYWAGDMILKEGTAEEAYGLNRFPFTVVKLSPFIGKNDIFGMFRNVKPIQDAYNFAMLRVQNMLSGAKIMVEDDAVDSIDEFAMQYSVDNGIIKVRAGSLVAGKIREINNARDIAGILKLMEKYERDAQEVLGINDEILGFDTRVLSGEAIERRQRAGILAIVDLLDALVEVDRDLFKIVIQLVKEFYRNEKIMAIADENSIEGYRRIVINEVIGIDEEGRPIFNPQTQLRLGEYDLIVVTKPAQFTTRKERYETGLQYLQTIAQIAPDVARSFLAMVIADSDYQNKDQLINMLNRSVEENVLTILQENPTLLRRVLEMAGISVNGGGML